MPEYNHSFGLFDTNTLGGSRATSFGADAQSTNCEAVLGPASRRVLRSPLVCQIESSLTVGTSNKADYGILLQVLYLDV